MSKPRKPAAPPAAPAIVRGAGDNHRMAMASITMAAARASVSRETLLDMIREYAEKPNKEQLQALRNAVVLGHVVGRLARAAGKPDALGDYLGAGAIIMAKAGPTAAKPKPAGKRTEDEERMVRAGDQYWFTLSVKADAAPTAGTGTGRSAAGKASAKAKAKRRATTTVAGVDVTLANKSPSAKPAPQAQPASAKPVTPTEAVAHVHAVAANLMAYLEQHGALFVPVVLAKAQKALGVLRGLPVPTH